MTILNAAATGQRTAYAKEILFVRALRNSRYPIIRWLLFARRIVLYSRYFRQCRAGRYYNELTRTTGVFRIVHGFRRPIYCLSDYARTGVRRRDHFIFGFLYFTPMALLDATCGSNIFARRRKALSPAAALISARQRAVEFIVRRAG